MSVIERKADCPPVEAFIWDRVARYWGDFIGIEQLSLGQLIELRALVEMQIAKVIRDDETPNLDCCRTTDK